MGRGLRCAALFAALILLSGCALPLPLKLASWAIDGISYIATEKSVTDHGISMVSGQDCALLRAVTKGKVCEEHAATTIIVDAGVTAESTSPESLPGVVSALVAFVAPQTDSTSLSAALLPAELQDLADSNLGMFSARGEAPILVVTARPPEADSAIAGPPEIFETAAGGDGNETASTVADDPNHALPEGQGMVELWQIGMAPPTNAREGINLAAAVGVADQVRRNEAAEVAPPVPLPEDSMLVANWNGAKDSASPLEDAPLPVFTAFVAPAQTQSVLGMELAVTERSGFAITPKGTRGGDIDQVALVEANPPQADGYVSRSEALLAETSRPVEVALRRRRTPLPN